MKLSLFLICFLFGTIFCNAQTSIEISWIENPSFEKKDVIFYKLSNKLNWADFKGMPNLPPPVSAITSSGFGYKAAMQSEDDKGEITVGIYCYFDKLKSWVRKGRNTKYTLNHEQHHFDITYLAAKMFIDKVKTASLTTSNMNEVLDKLYKECTATMKKMQNDYDGETKNGQLKDKQAEWNNIINRLLGLNY
jgi:FtsZ-binding cell division protein ZapB